MPFVLYVTLGILALLLVVCVVAMIFFKLTITRRDSWKEPEEETVGHGEKRALLLYQPSNGRHNVPLVRAVADVLAREGYTVTINYPSAKLTYTPGEYDLLVYGSPVYMGETSKALREYIQAHPVMDKGVLLFVTGMASETPELEALKLLLPDGNRISAVKVNKDEGGRLADFVKTHLPKEA